MSFQDQAALRLAGWRFGRGLISMFHPSGAQVRARQGVFSAERADGSKRHQIADQAQAVAWAMGVSVPGLDEAEPPRPHRATKSGHGGSMPPGWSLRAKGIYQHAHGTVESGHCSSKYLGRLTSGARELFKLRTDALVWVENNGVWPAGYVRAEKRP